MHGRILPAAAEPEVHRRTLMSEQNLGKIGCSLDGHLLLREALLLGRHIAVANRKRPGTSTTEQCYVRSCYRGGIYGD